MATEPQRKKVAILAADGFEQVELQVPRAALIKAGYLAEIVSPSEKDTVRGYHHTEPGDEFPVDVQLGRARPEEYAGLVLPGGLHNPDQLRQDRKAVEFVKHFFEEAKPVAAICHGPWLLIEAGVVAGRRLTSYASIKTDLRNAGADWSDEPVVVDKGLVTSRSPLDLPAFCKKMLEELKEGSHRSAAESAMLEKLGELIHDIRVAMLTTRDAEGLLHSRPMATLGKRFDGVLWFFNGGSSLKSHEIATDQEVNVSYAEPRLNRYVSVVGRAKVVRDRKKAEELWTPLLQAWFPKGLDDPDLTLVRVDVLRAEYWDAPAGKAVVLFGLAKSLLTGRPYRGEGAQHELFVLDGEKSRSTPLPAAEDAAPADEKAEAESDTEASDESADSAEGAESEESDEAAEAVETVEKKSRPRKSRATPKRVSR